MEQQNLLYSWEYDDSKIRSSKWYIIALSIAIGLIIWGFMTRQYGMSIVIMLLTGLAFFIENNSETHVIVQVSDLGISAQNNFYDYPSIASYSIVYNGDQAVFLRLVVKRSGVPVLNIPIDNTIAKNLQEILPNYIEGNDHSEITTLERITHFLQL